MLPSCLPPFFTPSPLPLFSFPSSLCAFLPLLHILVVSFPPSITCVPSPKPSPPLFSSLPPPLLPVLSLPPPSLPSPLHVPSCCPLSFTSIPLSFSPFSMSVSPTPFLLHFQSFNHLCPLSLPYFPLPPFLLPSFIPFFFPSCTLN